MNYLYKQTLYYVNDIDNLHAIAMTILNNSLFTPVLLNGQGGPPQLVFAFVYFSFKFQCYQNYGLIK